MTALREKYLFTIGNYTCFYIHLDAIFGRYSERSGATWALEVGYSAVWLFWAQSFAVYIRHIWTPTQREGGLYRESSWLTLRSSTAAIIYRFVDRCLGVEKRRRDRRYVRTLCEKFVFNLISPAHTIVHVGSSICFGCFIFNSFE